MFLDVLLGKLRPNRPSEKNSADENLQRQQFLRDGYRWASRCGPELNFVKADCTPIVYQDLCKDNQLSYAGTLTTSFHPESLRVDPTTGYFFHPSPGRKGRYGKFSLLRSSLVLDRLRTALVLDEEAQDHQPIGWLEWQGKRWPIGRLQPEDIDWEPE
ncbi:hypothetical protein CROQUDRAFT_667577 [Cronartium quercuum f. sp. fusiforme G11]|uniref:Uncharacterized protein n=1 Tax=Cronartium quercuum f. sp. fusiforme G11 TaxID=708437 RepID=A0A9P6NUI1_9BASI|nr:hypothetical protein CROQUDRAFT_667577 [Cronartium quercuum f. sp. fusiforme G11]